MADTNTIYYEIIGRNLKPFRPCHVSLKLNSNLLILKWEEKGRSYKKWIDNVDYTSPEINGQFCIQILKNNNIIDILYTKDRNITYDLSKIGNNNVSIRICHRNEFYGNGDWVEVYVNS